MSIYEDTNPRELKELLSQIHNGDTVLPEFQRDFVWDPFATQELIVSIASNYPAGSLLRIRNTKELFAYREFEGAPKLNGRKATYLVLDGQQRLTSLYQAFYGEGDHRFFLDLGALMHSGDFEESIFHLRCNHKKAAKFDDFAGQVENLTLPLILLREGSSGFLEWMMNADDQDGGKDLKKQLMPIYKKWIQNIAGYRFPVVTLSDSTEADAVCTIFETLNRTGVRLSPYELLTARFWPKKVNLRQLYQDAIEGNDSLRTFGVDPYYLLQSVALLSHKTPVCTRKAVLDLGADHIRKYWDKTVAGYELAIRILREDCGVLVPKWLPYWTMLIPMAAFLASYGPSKDPTAGAVRKKLSQWFWCSVFGQNYDSAANSQSAKDFGELLRWADGGKAPESVRTFAFDPDTLRDTTPKQRAIYRGVICLNLTKKPLDFHTRSPITANLIHAEEIDDHHIFPRDFLKNNSTVPERLRDCVLNRTLIDASTNRSIRNRATSAYLKEMKDTDGFPFVEVLSSHQVPCEDASPVWADDYEAFLDWRCNRFAENIRDITGMKEQGES